MKKKTKKAASKKKVVKQTIAKTNHGLTAKQDRFCEEYMVDVNGKKAAIRSGYSENTADMQASRLLTNDKVIEKIKELRIAQSQRTEITADRVLQEVYKIGFSDISKVMDKEGKLLPLSDWPAEMSAAISSIEVKEMSGITQTKVKLWDKNSALEKLFKHHGLYEHDNLQRNPLLVQMEELPAKIQELILEKLSALAGRPVLSGRSDSSTSKHVTH